MTNYACVSLHIEIKKKQTSIGQCCYHTSFNSRGYGPCDRRGGVAFNLTTQTGIGSISDETHMSEGGG